MALCHDELNPPKAWDKISCHLLTCLSQISQQEEIDSHARPTLSCWPWHPHILYILLVIARFYFQLITIWGERYESCFILLHMATQFFQGHLSKRLPFLQYMFWTTLSRMHWHTCVFLFLRFPLMSVCMLYQSRAVLLTMALQYFLKSNIMVPLALFFYTSSLVSLVFAYEFQSYFSNSVKKRSDTDSVNYWG